MTTQQQPNQTIVNAGLLDAKPTVFDEIKVTGIFASASISRKTGHQHIIMLASGKQVKIRNLYVSPDFNRILPGTSITIDAKEVEWVMSDFNGFFIGSRIANIVPVAAAEPLKKAA